VFVMTSYHYCHNQ